ncbi:MAG: glycosyltransferase family 2 protein [Herpetosiphon sp.]
MTRTITIIPNYNGGALLMDAVASLLHSGVQQHDIIVVDDASPDCSGLALSRRFPSIALIRNVANSGFAYSANRGINAAFAAGADFAFLFNNDAIVEPATLPTLQSAVASDPLIAAAMPMIYFHADPQKIQSTGLRVNRNTGYSEQIGWQQHDRGQFSTTEEREALHGCAMLIRRTAWQAVGPFWEPYFAYFEESDWCLRARGLGSRLLFVPASRVWHHGGASFGHTSPLYTYLMVRNRLLFIQRNHHQWSWWKHGQPLVFEYLRTWGRLAIKRHDLKNASAIMRAVWDFARAKTGKP